MYDKAIKINPNDLDLWVNGVICLISDKKYDEALNFLEEGNKLFSENMDLLWLKVEIYERSNKIEKVFELSEYFLSQNHYNQKIAIQLKAHGFFLLEKYNDAIKYYKQLVLLDKFNISAFYGLYISNLNLNNIDEAKKSLDTMIKIDADNPEFYFYYANLLKNNSEYINANKYYDKAISINEDFRYYYSKGEALEMLNNKKDAIDSYQKGLQLILELLDRIYFDEISFKKINEKVNLFLEKLNLLIEQ
ncbi:tetratricopeptide repeat protein [Methanobrevibacter curvatus]|uniref:Tetratricopeptide repeat protein n=1 Tax=Methanobrevibacter curvatus TaxID=49547 RepID=A0A166D7I8_9EURY|nr:tetratricopeptide repeat protein [Methanobrevibacter curvatus]KZX15286.1 tetratricopeptide repeat protein [Methanobrevibacter curvatus]